MAESELSAVLNPKHEYHHKVYRYTSGPGGHYPYTDYEPIVETDALLYQAHPSQVSIPDHASDLLRELRRRPEELFRLAPRQFEQIVAAIFREQGFDVFLTPATRDGGVDVYADRAPVPRAVGAAIEAPRTKAHTLPIPQEKGQIRKAHEYRRRVLGTNRSRTVTQQKLLASWRPADGEVGRNTGF